MRICFISFYFLPMVGGAETQSERQARQLQALGNDVIVVTLQANKRWQQREVLDGLPVVRVGGMHRRDGQLRVGRLGYLPYAIEMFLTLWRLRHKYDVIHVFQVTPLAAVAALIGKLTHKPVLISNQSTGPSEAECRRLEHGGMLMADMLPAADYLKVDVKDLVTGDVTYMPQAVLGGNLILNFLRKAKVYYHVNSARNYSYIIANGFRAEQIVRIPHGVDTEKYRPVPGQWANSAQPERTIICVARLDYAKGIDVLLHAWARLMHTPAEWRTHLQLRLRLIGDGLLRLQLERIVADLGIQDSVEFLGMRKDVPELLQQSWGFVCPSRWESLPNALLEAMACGLPCVATRVSGSEDIIIDGINGLMVEPEQPVEMATALRRILEDSDLAQRLGRMARAAIIPDYQLTTVVKRFMELYRQLITGTIRGGTMSNPRVYIVISTFHPLVGGSEKQALLQGRSLRQRGYAATVITFRHRWSWPPREVIEGVPVIRVAGRLLGKRENLSRLQQKLLYLMAMIIMGWTLWRERDQYDIIHLYHLNLLALPVALACRLTGKPMIVAVRSALLENQAYNNSTLVAGPLNSTTPWLRVDDATRIIHDLGDLERFGRSMVQLTRSLLQRNRAAVVVLSSRMQGYLAAHNFSVPDIQLIPNGVDSERFNTVESMNEPGDDPGDHEGRHYISLERSEATCSGDPRGRQGTRAQTVVCISRLSYEKGIDVLLQAWYLVQRQMPQARLIIVGDGPLQPQLVCMVEALGIADSVEFTGAQSNIPAQLQRGSIGVLPSRHEGMPNAVLEAMACGLPCVATRVSGSEDIIEHGVNGLLVEIEDYQRMAHALLTLLTDPVVTRKYGKAARSTIEKKYSLAHVTNMYEQLYHKMMGSRFEKAEQKEYITIAKG